jgi:hypothetical protein
VQVGVDAQIEPGRPGDRLRGRDRFRLGLDAIKVTSRATPASARGHVPAALPVGDRCQEGIGWSPRRSTCA